MTAEGGAARLGIVLALAAASAFGTNVVSAQIAGTAGLSGALLVFYRVALMLVLVAVIGLAWRLPFAVPRRDRVPLALFGASTAGVGLAYLSSVSFIPVTVAAVVFYTFPLLIVLAEPLVTSMPLRRDRAAIAVLAFIGVALVVGPHLDRLDPRGLVLAHLASVMAATQFFAANACRGTATTAKLFWSHLVILPLALLVLAVAGGFRGPGSAVLAPIAVAVTIGGYLIGFILQVLALARTSPGAAALAFCAEPVVAVAVAAAVLGERATPLQYGGAALVLAAILLNVTIEQNPLRPRSHQPATEPP